MFDEKDAMMRGGEISSPCAFSRNGTEALRKEGILLEYSAAYRLADEIRASEEYRTYHDLKAAVMGDETQAALIREYRRMQVEIQMKTMAGQSTEPEEMQRFSGLTGLLFGKPEVSQFLLAEMRLQQTLADIFKIITDAAGLEIQLPG